MKKIAEKMDSLLEAGGIKKDICLLAVSGVALICSYFNLFTLPVDVAWVAIILCGIPIVMEALVGLITSFDIKADVLVAMALIASVCIGEDFAAGEVAFIMQLGELLEQITTERARSGIEKLVKLTPQTARLILPEGEETVPATQVTVGAHIRVLPGEAVPVDGVIVSGQTSVNQAIVTGESLPVDKVPGDEVFSGTVNQFGAFEMEATKIGEDSSIQRMIRLVQSADAGKAKIVGLADRWATWIVVAALTAAVLAWIFTGEIIRAVTVLVVFCPCALVLATPTAIMAAIGNATKHGFLVKEGDALERLASVTDICFDKTGTLTVGVPSVAAFKSLNEACSDKAIYRLAACAEQSSEHPLGKALTACYIREYGDDLGTVERFCMLPGRGITACVDGKQIVAGNLKLMAENGIDTARFADEGQLYSKQGCTLIYISIDGAAAGVIAMSDTPRPGMANAMKKMTELGVVPVLVTGDNRNAADAVAGKLNIARVVAECMPEDKLSYIDGAQQQGRKVCMVGDGINDAPALKTADVGIAMGGAGNAIAVEAADIALVDDKIEELPHLFALSGKMMKTIRLNMIFSMAVNFVAVILAVTGVLNPIVGALVHNCGSVLVILNSAILLKWHKKTVD